MKKIPIKTAKQISEDTGYPEIVIFAYDPVSGRQHVTTYGKTLEQCKDAAKAGNYLKKALGWPEELCNAQPARSKKFIFKIILDADDDFLISNRYLIDNNDIPYLRDDTFFLKVHIEVNKKEDLIKFLEGIVIKPKHTHESYMNQFNGYVQEVNSVWKKMAIKEIKKQIKEKERIYFNFGGNHEIEIQEIVENSLKTVKLDFTKDKKK